MIVTKPPKKELRLNKDESLILFHILGKIDDKLPETTLDEKEWELLWNIEATIEKHFEEVIASNYMEQVAMAKKNIT